MPCSFSHFVVVLLVATVAPEIAGCGTTRSTDTTRTATEQLLVSDAIDRAVQSVNLKTLAGQTVYFDDSRLGDVVDRNYLVSTLRQHLLASGCALRDKREEADFVVEARAGAVGTDRNDLLFGVPSINVPQIAPVQPVPGAAIPEIPIAKRRDQRGIAKIAVFAYHRETGTPVWQSGVAFQESSANDVWILGAGPFQRGTIYDGTAFAGKALGNERSDGSRSPIRLPPLDLAQENTFTPPNRLAKKAALGPAAQQGVVHAVHEEPLPIVTSPVITPIHSAAPEAGAADTAAPSSQPPDDSPLPTPAASSGTPSVYLPPASTPLPQPRFSSR